MTIDLSILNAWAPHMIKSIVRWVVPSENLQGKNNLKPQVQSALLVK